MGQQQLLLILLGIIIVGIALSIGIMIYSSQSIESNRDSLVGDINNLSSDGYGYYMRARILGGGQGSFIGFSPSPMLLNNADGNMVMVIAGDGNSITFTANSKYGYGTVSSVLSNSGQLGTFVFTGDFLQ